jgi:hypothetical protein
VQVFLVACLPLFFLWCVALSTTKFEGIEKKNVARFLEAKVKPNNPQISLTFFLEKKFKNQKPKVQIFL